MKVYIFLLCSIVSFVSCEVYFSEKFDDGDSWRSRWTTSKHKSDYGEFKLTAGKFFLDAEEDKGLQTSQDARFYADSAHFTSFSNEGKTLVIQFSVKHEQGIDCGGGYVKVFPSTVQEADMHGDSPYNIMFGPDICGPGTKKVHVIFRYKGENLLIKKDIRCKDDEFTHVYTLIVKPDNTYKVLIDNKEMQSGDLEADWEFLQPKQIKDPEASMPEDWDERERIDDPADEKPEDWDKPEHIADPDATQPEDWDEEMDGEWEPPMIDNPEYQGEWRPKQIDNPDYKGKWIHPMIDNPDYAADDKLYAYDDFGVIGLDLWQVKSGTIFDNFLITDDEEFAKEEAANIIPRSKAEDKQKAEQEDAEKAAAEAEAAADEDDEDEEEIPEEEELDEDVEEDEPEEEVEEVQGKESKDEL